MNFCSSKERDLVREGGFIISVLQKRGLVRGRGLIREGGLREDLWYVHRS